MCIRDRSTMGNACAQNACMQKIQSFAFPKTEEEMRDEHFREVTLRLLQEGEMFTRIPTGMISMLQSNQPGFLKLNDAKTALCWASLEQANAKPAHQVDATLDEVHSVMQKGQDGLVIRDKGDGVLIELQSDSADIGVWVQALNDAMGVLSGKVHAKAEKEAKREKRLEELQKRQADRDAKKAALGVNGMQHTARVMLSK
eukprot:TRINITY_DN13383_c0_g1_i1.p1 TRINITY_DN13383_c0_g1~~TRINITY_DN13383_c0_g1_i1.p1  ORF type:complete len:200 (+),score=46.93 TRINITY_DN13383_c0_g1_i1:116-715(+)